MPLPIPRGGDEIRMLMPPLRELGAVNHRVRITERSATLEAVSVERRELPPVERMEAPEVVLIPKDSLQGRAERAADEAEARCELKGKEFRAQVRGFENARDYFIYLFKKEDRITCKVHKEARVLEREGEFGGTGAAWAASLFMAPGAELVSLKDRWIEGEITKRMESLEARESGIIADRVLGK